jgi:hypothetical protein
MKDTVVFRAWPDDNKPAHRFRLYPLDTLSGLYVLLNIWPTPKAMKAHARNVVGYTRKFEMLTSHTLIRYSHGRICPMFAEVNMQLEYTCVGAVSHELVHATSAYFRRLGLTHTEDNDELFAHVQGWLLLQFVHRAQKAGVYK